MLVGDKESGEKENIVDNKDDTEVGGENDNSDAEAVEHDDDVLYLKTCCPAAAFRQNNSIKRQ